MTKSISHSRRTLLKHAASFTALGAGAPLALNLSLMGAAAAQSSTSNDYKALVCIFLAGGNDAFNTVLATDSTSWNAYIGTRGQGSSSIALPQSSLRGLNPVTPLANRTLALHPQLTGLQQLFNNQRRLSVMANVGPLTEPLTKEEYIRKLKRFPAKLFSHNDQQSTWQALAPEGVAQGWGGRLAELASVSAPNGNSLFTGISAAGNSVWVSGKTTKQYQMQSSGVLRFGTQIASGNVNHIYGSPLAADKLQKIATRNRSRHVFEADISEVNNRSIKADHALRSALPDSNIVPYGPDSALVYYRPDGTRAVNPLARQLQAVARSIGARAELGMRRQVYYVSLGGFDTHDNQTPRHADLMAQLNHAMVYFDAVVAALNLLDHVTTFTASDFGRSFTSNGDGTDHGWGAHQFVMGGAVQGGSVIGKFPQYSSKNNNDNYFDGSPDQVLNGVLLPTTSVEQFGASLGRWFGVSDTDMADVFPNLSRMGTIPSLMKT